MASSAVSSTRCRRYIDEAASAPRTGYFAILPQALLAAVLALLPADERARSAAVHSSWRAALADPAMWTRLDLSRASGIARSRVTSALLLGAASKAGGGLTYLNLEDCYHRRLKFEDVKRVAEANATSLRTLHLQRRYSAWDDFEPDAAHIDESLDHYGQKWLELEALLQAAPALQELTTDVVFWPVFWPWPQDWDVEHARRMLRNEGRFMPLRLEYMTADFVGVAARDFTELMALVLGHATLTGLGIWSMDFEHAPALLDAVVDGKQACSHVQELEFYNCDFGDAAAALAQLLSATSSLASLRIRYDSATQLLSADAAALLAGELRSNCSLTSLKLVNADLWADPAAGGALFSSLVAHRSLRTLVWREDGLCKHPGLVGVALHGLVAANAPALRNLEVDVWMDDLRGHGPLFDALPRNTHLRCLDCMTWFMAPSFARFVLLPAVRANTSLRQLFLPLHVRDFDDRDDLDRILIQAAALVSRRNAVRRWRTYD